MTADMHSIDTNEPRYHRRPDYEVKNDSNEEDEDKAPPPRQNNATIQAIQELQHTIESLRTQMESYANL